MVDKCAISLFQNIPDWLFPDAVFILFYKIYNILTQTSRW